MAIDPVSAGLEGAGLLASLFAGGGGAELPPEMKRLYAYLMKLSREQYRYSKGVPGSDPQELAALAQAKALAGQDLGGQYQNLLAALGTSGATASNSADALASYNSRAGGQMAGIDASMLLGFLNARKNGRLQAAQIAGMAGGPGSNYGPQQNTGTDLAGIFGSLAQQHTFNKALGSFKPADTSVNYHTIKPPAGSEIPQDFWTR